MVDRDCEYIVRKGSEGSYRFRCVYGRECDSDDHNNCEVYDAAKRSEEEEREGGSS